MLKNIVLLKWKDDVLDEQLDAVKAALAGLQGEIPEVCAISYGADKGLVKNNADFAIATEFDTEADFQTYLTHPAHQALVGKLVVPMMASMQSIQFDF